MRRYEYIGTRFKMRKKENELNYEWYILTERNCAADKITECMERDKFII